MKAKKIISLSILLALSFSCAKENTINLEDETTQISRNKTTGIEELVTKANIEQNLGILSSKNKLPDGSVIPERGTKEGRAKTKKYIMSVLESYGYKPEKHIYRQDGENIFTILKADVQTDEHILVGAHMDSVKNMGADDNATGSSAVLEMSRVLKELKGRKVNIIFAWFDEEELGLVGSYAMAKDFKKKGLKISSVHTMDMVGYDSDKDNNMEIEQPDGILWDYYNMVNKSHNLNFPLIRTNGGDTDHVAFRETGFQAVGICEEWYHGDTTPQYHKKGDSYETLNFDFLTNVTKLASAVVGDLSMKVAAPSNIEIKPHSQFPSRKRAHFHKSYEEIE